MLAVITMLNTISCPILMPIIMYLVSNSYLNPVAIGHSLRLYLKIIRDTIFFPPIRQSSTKLVLTGILESIKRNMAILKRVPPFRKNCRRSRINDQITLKKHQVNFNNYDLEKGRHSRSFFLYIRNSKTDNLLGRLNQATYK